MFACGDIVVCFEDVCAVSLRVAIQHPPREHDQTPAVPRGVNDLAFPVIITKQLFVDFRQRFEEFRLKQIVSDSAERFLRDVAVSFCGPCVPVSDPVVVVANDDGIVGQIQQARLLGELLFVALALAQIDDGGLVEQGAICYRRGDRCT